MSVRPYVLCGGSGTRLWPLSTAARPKPLLQLPGHASTLLRQTLQRLEDLSDEAPVLLCGAAHEQAIGLEAPGCPRLVEPRPRGTALAIVAAAVHARRAGGGVVLVVPSDHVIGDVPAFHDAVHRALPTARDGRLVVIGVQPGRPATEFGWIERGEGDANAVLPVVRFVEKPDVGDALRLFTSGTHLWNAGMVLADAEVVLAEAGRHVPEVLAAAEAALDGAREEADATWLDDEAVDRCPEVSFDVGVLERSERVSVVGAAMGWSDVGSWDAVVDPLPEEGTNTVGDVLASDCHGSLLVQRGERPLAAVGLRDTVVVSCPEGVLVVARGASQGVGPVARTLAERVQRPWGDYEVLDAGPGYVVKRLRVSPQQRTSLQTHEGRSERWTVAQGQARVHLDGVEHELAVGEQIDVPRGAVHRLSNPGKGPLVVIEVQLGEVLDEEDIVRLNDDYGRA